MKATRRPANFKNAKKFELYAKEERKWAFIEWSNCAITIEDTARSLEYNGFKEFEFFVLTGTSWEDCEVQVYRSIKKFADDHVDFPDCMIRPINIKSKPISKKMAKLNQQRRVAVRKNAVNSFNSGCKNQSVYEGKVIHFA